MGPLIPYIRIPELPLTPLASVLHHFPIIGQYFDPNHPPTIKPFGALVALAVYVGTAVALRHAKQRGLSAEKMTSFMFWVVGVGFIGGHVLDAVFYHPDRLAKNPLYLFALWDGLSSYGGFIGSIVGALLYRAVRHEKVLPYVEACTSAFPLAWVFGRAGCATVHDHPGAASDRWFAVKWPLPMGGYAGKYDLGLIEMVLAIPLAVVFLVLWRRKPFRPLGFYSGWMCIAYAPIRFLLDFLREDDAHGGDVRYGGLTPAQWACFGLLAFGVYLVWYSRKPENETKPPPAKDESAADDRVADADDSSEGGDESKAEPAKSKSTAASESAD